MSGERAVATAREALGIDDAVRAEWWVVARYDHPGRDYHLVVFGEPWASVGVAIVDRATGRLETSARLAGRGPHLRLDAPEAIRLAGFAPASPPRLVWAPGRASRSPLYPLWELSDGARLVRVDQSGGVWTDASDAAEGRGG